MKRFFKYAFAMVVCLITAVLGVFFWYFPRYLACAKPVSVTPAGENTTVMGYNLRCIAPEDLGKKSWFYRAGLVLEDIRTQKPGILGFQEATWVHYNFLVKTLPQYDSVITYRDDFVLSEGCPIFYHRDLYTLKDKGSFWLSETPEVMSKDWGSACYRICSYVILTDKATGRDFVVFNTHLDHISDEARIKGMEVVLDKIAQFGGLPAVLMGDLNAEEDSATIHAALEHFRDARYAAPETEDSYTYQNWGNLAKAARIDYFMISDGIAPIRYDVLTDTHDGVYSSDHCPIVLTFTLEPPAQSVTELSRLGQLLEKPGTEPLRLSLSKPLEGGEQTLVWNSGRDVILETNGNPFSNLSFRAEGTGTGTLEIRGDLSGDLQFAGGNVRIRGDITAAELVASEGVRLTCHGDVKNGIFTVWNPGTHVTVAGNMDSSDHFTVLYLFDGGSAVVEGDVTGRYTALRADGEGTRCEIRGSVHAAEDNALSLAGGCDVLIGGNVSGAELALHACGGTDTPTNLRVGGNVGGSMYLEYNARVQVDGSCATAQVGSLCHLTVMGDVVGLNGMAPEDSRMGEDGRHGQPGLQIHTTPEEPYPVVEVLGDVSGGTGLTPEDRGGCGVEFSALPVPTVKLHGAVRGGGVPEAAPNVTLRYASHDLSMEGTVGTLPPFDPEQKVLLEAMDCTLLAVDCTYEWAVERLRIGPEELAVLMGAAEKLVIRLDSGASRELTAGEARALVEKGETLTVG